MGRRTEAATERLQALNMNKGETFVQQQKTVVFSSDMFDYTFTLLNMLFGSFKL